jgi:hypothetical protein
MSNSTFRTYLTAIHLADPIPRRCKFGPECPAPIQLPLFAEVALISSIVATALCVKPRGMLTESQKAKLAVLKSSLPSSAVMRVLAVRFRVMMRSGKADGLDAWLRDAVDSGSCGMRIFARGLQKDLAAVRNSVDDEMVEWPSRRTDVMAFLRLGIAS